MNDFESEGLNYSDGPAPSVCMGITAGNADDIIADEEAACVGSLG